MPELPEVENVCISIKKSQNLLIKDVYYSGKKLKNLFDIKDLELLINNKIRKIYRKGKYIIFQLDNNLYIVSHLGMSGVFLLNNERSLSKHDHIVIYFENNLILKFNDIRRFGMFQIVNNIKFSQLKFLNNLGIDALDSNFNEVYLYEKLKNINANIKHTLLNQTLVAGIGNIYASESLFKAQISPLCSAKKLSKIQTKELVYWIKFILNQSINNGGSTLRDYKKSDGSIGNFQNLFSVYQKQGVPCVNNCGCLIVKIMQNQRSTFYCPDCQK